MKKKTKKKPLTNLEMLINETVRHFKKDKWPLDLKCLKDEMFYALAGVNASEYLISELKKKKVDVHFNWDDQTLELKAKSK